MAFRKRQPLPDWRKRQLAAKEVEQEQKAQEKTDDLMGFTGWTDAELAEISRCICPRRGCPIHPDSPINDIAEQDKKKLMGRTRGRKRS